jgi:hypothetical protein
MVIAMMAQGDASNIASNILGQREKKSLLAMKALIERHLKEIEDDEKRPDKGEAEEEKVQRGVDVDMEL